MLEVLAIVAAGNGSEVAGIGRSNDLGVRFGALGSADLQSIIMQAIVAIGRQMENSAKGGTPEASWGLPLAASASEDLAWD